MAVAVLFETPTNQLDFAVWSFAHLAHHRDIARVIFAESGIIVPEYIIDPFDPREDLSSWLYQHQVMHIAQNEALGIAGFNLTEVEWSDPDSLGPWLWNHAQEHFQAATILNLG